MKPMVLVRPAGGMIRAAGFAILAAVLAAVTAARGQEAATGDTRLPVPAAAEIDAEAKSIREIVADAYKTAEKQNDYEPLVADLNQRAGREDAPAHRYALYREAERLAVEGGLYGRALEIAADRCRQFKADTLDTRMTALERIVKQNDEVSNDLGIEFAKRTIDVALAAESFPAAERAVEALAELGKRQTADMAKRRAAITKKYKKKIPLPNLLGSLVADITAIKDEVAKSAKRRADHDAVAARLKGGGGDEGAATAAGVYLALQKNDWSAALPVLRRIRGPVGAAAKGEIDARAKNSPEALVEAGTAWWTLGDAAAETWNTDALDAAAYKSHAADCYLAALPKLAGKVARDLVTTRIREAPSPRALRIVEADALNCRAASEAMQVYKVYAANSANPPYLAGLVEARSRHWEQLASEKRVKLGDRWLKPGDHERETAAADEKVGHALDLLRGGQFDLAKKELDEASELNPETAKAEFFIGLVYAVMDNDLIAIEHWLEGVKREPNHAALLNNLAVSEVVSGRHRSAINHFRQASRLLPEPAIVGNIAYAVKLSSPLGIKGKDLDDLNDLARQTQAMLRASPQPPRDPNAGGGAGQQSAGGTDIATVNRFVYVLPYASSWDAAANARRSSGGGGTGGDKGRGAESLGSVSIGYGTGFVVAPGVVLTNEHVVRSAREVMVHDPGDFTRQLVATVIASDKDLDLALLEVKELKAPPLKLAEALPPRTTDIMAMGFPGGPNLLGNRLKSTKGSVIAPGDPTLDGGNFLHSCLINPGNSGGPIVDEFGEVIGVVRAIAKISEIGDSYSIGIPVDRVLPFIDEHRKKFEPPPAPPADGQPAPPVPPADPSAPPPAAPPPGTPVPPPGTPAPAAADPAAAPLPSGGVRGQAEALKSKVEGSDEGASVRAAGKPAVAAKENPQDEDSKAVPEKERRKMAWPEVDAEASRSVLLIVCKAAAR